MGLNREAPATKNRKNGHLFDFIVATRDKTAYFHRRDRVFYQKDKGKDGNTERTPVCLAMFKSYSEVDLIELKRV